MRHELGPQDLPTGVKFGMLDGNAVRFTNFEAWWLVDGAWQPIFPGEVLSDAAVMREARFKQLFPQGLPVGQSLRMAPLVRRGKS